MKYATGTEAHNGTIRALACVVFGVTKRNYALTTAIQLSYRELGLGIQASFGLDDTALDVVLQLGPLSIAFILLTAKR